MARTEWEIWARLEKIVQDAGQEREVQKALTFKKLQEESYMSANEACRKSVGTLWGPWGP